MTASRDRMRQAFQKVFGTSPETIQAISGGDWASVYLIEGGGQKAAAKCPHQGHENLATGEGDMLSFLNEKTDVPWPRVLHVEKGLLLISFVENNGHKGETGGEECGRFLAKLHSVTASKFGFETDTIFGPLTQPNNRTSDWVGFYRDHRLLYGTRLAHEAEQINGGMRRRMERLCGDLDQFLLPVEKPSLLHGDFWGGNVLYNRGHCAAFIDPAIYFGHPEADLAFASLFGSFGNAFYDAYREIYPIEDGFFETRLDLYNLWPLLFHAYYFGGHYGASIDSILKKLGY